MPFAEQTSALVPLIYEAALEPRAWQPLLNAFTSIVGGESSVLHLQRLSAGAQAGQVVAAVGVDAAAERRYDEHYASVNIWTQRGRHLLREGAVITGEMACSDAEVERSEYYNDYLHPLGLRYAIGAVPSADTATTLILSCLRGRNAGPFGASAVDVLRSLTPHLKRAAVIHDRLTAARHVEHAESSALDRWHMGVVVLDEHGRVLLVNRRCRELLASDGTLVLTSRGLGARESKCDALLQAAVKSAQSRKNGPTVAAVLRISGLHGDRSYELLVCPSSNVHPLVPARGGGGVTIFIGEAGGAKVDVPVLMKLYGLTAAECKVVEGLAAGQSTEEIAEVAGWTVSTARWFVKQVLHKTECRTQAQLVARVLSGVAVVRHDERA